MSIKKKILEVAIRTLQKGVGVSGVHNAAVVSAQIAEQLTPVRKVDTPAGSLSFFCPGRIPLWRAETLLTKEPETIEWIDGFASEDVFWDIGANIGVYSLYAALKPGIRVLAFEPAAVNAYVLNRNIEINNLDDRVSWFGIAFADITGLDQFHMSTTAMGGALHGYAESVDSQGKPFSAVFRQGALGFTIDEFVDRFHPPFPSHIKIDVDGIEHRIVAGAEKTLKDSRVRSVLIELDAERDECRRNVCDRLQDAGLRLIARKHASMFDSGAFATTFNYIFAR